MLAPRRQKWSQCHPLRRHRRPLGTREHERPILTKESRHMSKLMFLDVSGLLDWNILHLWIAIWNKLSLLARKLARNRCVVLKPFEGARSLTAPCRVPLTGSSEIQGLPITRNMKSLNSNRCQTIHTSFSGMSNVNKLQGRPPFHLQSIAHSPKRRHNTSHLQLRQRGDAMGMDLNY